MCFYVGERFPQPYRDEAFVAMHGSWNPDDPVGYKVVRVFFGREGQPRGSDDGVTGFLDENDRLVYGRSASPTLRTARCS
jgi:glucose/arabinose dehydrogenase